MTALGADKAEAERDYYASLNAFTERSEDYAKQFTALGYPADVVAKTRRLVSVSEDMFDNIYAWLCERYGSTERYLNEVIGLSAVDRECLRRRCLEK